MTLELVMPDTVAMLVTFCRAQSEIVALVAAPTSIRGKLDQGVPFPAVKVTRIASEPQTLKPLLLENVRMQFDCYGGNNRQAERLAQAIRSSLMERATGYANSEGIITRVEPSNLQDLPDESFEPTRERYILEMLVRVKPLTH